MTFICIHFKKIIVPDYLILKCIDLVVSKNPANRFLINISPKNKKSINFFKRNGFKLIQYTFEKEIIKK